MKILCPIDFSNASVNACRWAIALLDELGGGQLQLLHCLNVVSRSAMFIKMDVIYRERAEEDLRKLQKELQPLSVAVDVDAYVVNLDPKSFVPEYASKKHFDLVVTGTKGLSALKDMTVGSVTAHLMDHSKVPVLCVPETVSYDGMKVIVLGVDDKKLTSEALAPLAALRKSSNASLQVVHTTPKDDLSVDYDPFLNLPLSEGTFDFQTIHQEESIPEALTAFAVSSEADLLVMIHRRRNWFERLFNNSIAKSELFTIRTPLLILPAN